MGKILEQALHRRESIQMEDHHENRLRFISHYDNASQSHKELQ